MADKEYTQRNRDDIEKTFTQSKGEREVVNKIRKFFGAEPLKAPSERKVKNMADLKKRRDERQ